MDLKNAKNNYKKSLVAFLILALLFGLVGNFMLVKKPAKAINATLIQQIIEYIMEIINWYQDYSSQTEQEDSLDEISDVQDWFKDDTLDRRDERESWNEDRQDMLEDLVNNILDGIKDQGGGETAFITHWEDFLNDYTKEAYQSFVDNGLNQSQMCNTFASEVKSEISSGNEPSYTTQVQCPSSYDSAALLAGTSQDYWSDWLYMIRPSGNPFGAYMISSDAKLEAEGLAFTNRFGQLIANQGYQGTESTPGIMQSYAAQRASMMDLDNLLQSTELETYFSSVADAFINRIFSEGLASVQTTTYTSTGTTTYPPTVSTEEQTATYVEETSVYTDEFSDRLNLTIENLNDMVTAQNNNLYLLNLIQAEQARCGVSMGSSLAEIATVINESNEAATNISLANQAITALDTLVTAMDAVTAAEQASDDAALTEAATAFISAHSSLLSIVNSITDGSATDITDMLSDLSDFNSDVINQTGSYVARLGVAGTPSSMTQYLYGWYASLVSNCSG